MKMVRLSIFITTIAIILAGNLAAQARLKIANDRFDMGSIPGGVTVSHCYWFKSVGSDTVFIDSMKTNCGCDLQPLESEWIAPGDSMRVSFCWKTNKTVGPTGSYPYIFTNDGVERIARVYLTGAIMKFPDSLRPLSFKPYIMDLSQFKDISNDSVAFSVRNRDNRDVTIRMLSNSVDECEISIPENVPAGSVAEGYVKVKPEFLDKEFNRSFTIEVEGERKSRVTLPVRRKIY